MRMKDSQLDRLQHPQTRRCIDYYDQALALDPNYTKARQYLGEAYLEKDEVGKAKEQFVEIANRCGGPCNDYELLVKAIAAHITGEEDTGW
jgi:lipoprotein NlpI